MARIRTSQVSAASNGTLTATPEMTSSKPRAAGATKRKKPMGQPDAPKGLNPAVEQGALLIGLGVCGFVALALASWHATDPSLSVAGGAPIQNLTGSVGAILADLLLQGFGYASWSVVVVAGMLSLRLAGRRVGGWGSAMLGATAFALLAVGIELVAGAPGRPFPAGGLLGAAGVQALVPRFGQMGTGIAVASALIGTVTVLFSINWQPMFARAVERVQTGVPMAARAVNSLGGAAVRAGANGLLSMRDRMRSDEEDGADGEEEQDDVSDAGDVAVPATAAERQSVAGSLVPRLFAGDDARPPAASVVDRPRLPDAAVAVRKRETPSLSDLPSVDLPAPPSVWAARAVPELLPIDDIDRDAPTQHSGRSLVEVEWERTQAPRQTSAPALGASPLRQPAVVPPSVAAPSVVAPSVVAPSVAAPSVAAPSVVAPSVATSGSPGSLVALSPTLRRAVSEDRPSQFDEALSDWAGGDRRSFPSVAPVRPPAPKPAPAVAAPVAAPPAVAAPPPASSTRVASAPAVVPGNLRSGGSNDDGRAVRAPNRLQIAFELPPLSLLDDHPAIVTGTDEGVLHELARKLTAKLMDFGVEGRVTAIRPGPVITMFEYEPAPGVKVSKISSLSDDLAMALRAMSVRIVAPIPGRGVVGMEIPNEKRQTVWARDVFASKEFRDSQNILPVVLGKDTEGRPYVGDLAKMPHLLVGGTTGSGKSVGVNAMLCSLLLTKTPEELRMILVDPKMLEFELYKDIPHLLHPVVTEPKLASAVLKWACVEMDERYRMLARWQTRNIEGYNQRVVEETADWTPEKARKFAPKDWPEGDLLPLPRKLAYIVVVIDELADLMMVAAKDVEESIVRIAQKARACGIHLIVATQRPSVDVITGLIKANMPSRLAYQVRQKNDGRTILDQNGAEALLGRGDLLFLPPGTSGLIRAHGPLLTDEEVRRITDHCREQGAPDYAPAIKLDDGDAIGDEDLAAEKDENYDRAVDFAIEKGKISTSMIQRLLKIGYNRAARMMEIMEQEGVVGPADGAKPREVLVQAR